MDEARRFDMALISEWETLDTLDRAESGGECGDMNSERGDNEIVREIGDTGNDILAVVV
jgi:hypothetical protein